jgi:ribulose-phosphate 3-epimerase
LRAVTDSLLDVHLMIDNPQIFLEPFVRAGADMITIHQEVSVHLHRDLHEIRRLGVRVGVALNPSTPVDTLREVLPFVDLVLVMTVNPGFGGQAFIGAALSKVQQVRRMARDMGIDGLHVQVDGGIGPETAPAAARAGADVLVAGSSIFRGPGSIRENYEAIRTSLSVRV